MMKNPKHQNQREKKSTKPIKFSAEPQIHTTEESDDDLKEAIRKSLIES